MDSKRKKAPVVQSLVAGSIFLASPTAGQAAAAFTDENGADIITIGETEDMDFLIFEDLFDGIVGDDLALDTTYPDELADAGNDTIVGGSASGLKTKLGGGKLTNDRPGVGAGSGKLDATSRRGGKAKVKRENQTRKRKRKK